MNRTSYYIIFYIKIIYGMKVFFFIFSLFLFRVFGLAMESVMFAKEKRLQRLRLFSVMCERKLNARCVDFEQTNNDSIWLTIYPNKFLCKWDWVTKCGNGKTRAKKGRKKKITQWKRRENELWQSVSTIGPQREWKKCRQEREKRNEPA